MIVRQAYLDALIRQRNTQAVKVITGIRRSGKTALLDRYVDYLKADGVPDGQILQLDLDEGEYSDIETGVQLYEYLEGGLPRGGKVYVILDEIQRIESFEKALEELSAKETCDIYVTLSSGSLSAGHSPSPAAHLTDEGEVAGRFFGSYLSGVRYAEISVFPLSFREYVSAFPADADTARLFADYVRDGALLQPGFPIALSPELPPESPQEQEPWLPAFSPARDRKRYLRDVFDTIVLKDIITRRKFPDIAMLQSVARFMFENVGYICSTKSVADIMTKAGKKISVHTAESYLAALTDSFILRKTGRYDIKGKQFLKTGCKYYAADTGLRYALLGADKAGRGHVLENIVYLELLHRGYEIHIGKVGNTEVDFMAVRGGEVEYYQAARTMIDADGTALKRELAPLEAINDNNPKCLLTMDRTPSMSHNGIKQMNIIEWLLR